MREQLAKKPVLVCTLMIILAIALGLLVSALTADHDSGPEPAPEVTSAMPVETTPAPTPTPTPTPTVTAIHLYAYGRELDEAGFTLHVGDDPVELTAMIEPIDAHLPVGWTFSDQSAASLEVSSDGLACRVTALKPNGRNDLTVMCQNLYTSIPVYLWDK